MPRWYRRLHPWGWWSPHMLRLLLPLLLPSFCHGPHPQRLLSLQFLPLLLLLLLLLRRLLLRRLLLLLRRLLLRRLLLLRR